MKHKGWRIAGLGVLVITVVIAGWVLAQGHGVLPALHGQAHHMEMMRLVSELDLKEEQEQHIENIHQILSDQREEMVHLHGHGVEWMLERLETGYVDGVEVRSKIDVHAEQFRELGYRIGNELVALFNSLDEEQRAIFTEHLEKVAELDHGVFRH